MKINNEEERPMKTRNIWKLLLAGAVLAALPMWASAQEDSGTKTARELRASYDKALQGKTIAYLPIALGTPLADEWGRVARHEIRRARSQQQSVRDAAGADCAGRPEARRANRAEPQRHAADEGSE